MQKNVFGLGAIAVRRPPNVFTGGENFGQVTLETNVSPTYLLRVQIGTSARTANDVPAR